MDAKDAGKLMQAHRKRVGLTQDQAVEKSTVPTPQYLSALENGRYDVRNSEHFKSLVEIYGLTPEQVQEISPNAVFIFEAKDTPRRGPPIPPVVPFRETTIRIPDELQRMIDNNADRYPELRDPATQRIIAAPRNFGGPDVGPQTEEDWLEYFLVTRRYLK